MTSPKEESNSSPELKTTSSKTSQNDNSGIVISPVSSHLKKKVQTARRRMLIAANIKGSKNKENFLQKLFKERLLSFRLFTLLGGFIILISSCLDYFGSFQTLGYGKEAPGFLVLLLLASLIIQLEGRPYHLQSTFLYNSIILLFLPFLLQPLTRSVFYFIVGTYQYYQYTLFNMISGIYFVCTGTVSFLLYHRAADVLTHAHLYLKNEADVKFLFSSFDEDRDGYLNPHELKQMLTTFDEDIGYNNLLFAAMSRIDIHNNRKISYDELYAWFGSFDESDGIQKSQQQESTPIHDDKAVNLLDDGI